jgi:hypothetical protein
LALPLFIVLYVPSTFFLEHYAVLVAPAVILSLLMGGRALAAAWPRWGGTIFAVFAVAVLTTAVTSLWEINRHVAMPGTEVMDETFPSTRLRYLQYQLPTRAELHTPAVVLFPYFFGWNYFEEPVYNTDVAWPFDATIMRAHDLGEHNQVLFDYLARTQPDRTIYRFNWRLYRDRQDPLIPLGTARELGRSG